jgi:hypothetical protein
MLILRFAVIECLLTTWAPNPSTVPLKQYIKNRIQNNTSGKLDPDPIQCKKPKKESVLRQKTKNLRIPDFANCKALLSATKLFKLMHGRVDAKSRFCFEKGKANSNGILVVLAPRKHIPYQLVENIKSLLKVLGRTPITPQLQAIFRSKFKKKS